ncbi:Phosphofructokinase family protein [Trichomonas vaginalis G3]|uniref:Phosphofructokinase family protein n=1 Tax=Trichomonas vaginalis (strain ATCC PRA-98 / G3) TaxID=412133 RepID=A2DRM7_TRIV3|nr:pyrophosphate-dependent phosphofructokinase TM0289 type family [Trichomonas vaginalis G3]EAY16990.1 Phosphofructokinase family protein [Trichomonas vaginalis G3]KAI5508957.1 pyrophosphate-dependent phosphofructokinase TM0289 type family [Trichomonas vaginalis G3]|eukprot:XP_001329213.1 Phosphofructokinase family protein [Trichomonas vaginalis G3]
MSTEAPVLGIIIGGAPAPGLNGVIASATFYARQLGWKVIGFHDGYLHLATGSLEEVKANTLELNEDFVAPHLSTGGSIIRPHRYDPTKSNKEIHNVLRNLKEFHIRYLIIIGGNDKIATTHIITSGLDPAQMQVIAIPKTIDNDISLPYNTDTFGFHSARKFCSELVMNLAVDARSAPRWFIIETMGRRSGHLALSVSEATAAHLCIIPEDFKGRQVTLKEICDVFEGAILKRYLAGKPYGVCIITEGLIHYLPKEEIESLFKDGIVQYTAEGQLNLDEAEISRAIRNEMNNRLSKMGLDVRVNPKKIGYELRCMDPISADMCYTRELGAAAIEGFLNNHSNVMVVWENGNATYVSFRSLMNEEDGQIYPRLVDTKSQNYRISREYGWQVKKCDLDDTEKVEKLAKIAKITPEEFHKKFDPIMDDPAKY